MCTLFAGIDQQASAQLTITTGQTATQLANALTGTGVVVTNATLTCPDPVSSGLFSGTSNLGLSDGIILTNGRAATSLTTQARGVNIINGGNAYNNNIADNAFAAPGDADLNALTHPA